jgi:metal-sulfur cluster biosynthetic enzyme
MSDVQKEFTVEEQKVREVLKQVPDPEVGVNIVDLGLVYRITIDEESKKLDVDVTLSTPGCPVGDTIIQHIQNILEATYPDYDVTVNLVWEPQWNPGMITEEGKMLLNQ